MRKLALTFALTLLALSASAADYTGRWTLDKAKSSGLPPYYEQITAHDLKITQDDKELVVSVTITLAEPSTEGFEFRYRLDGTPVQTETMVRTPSGRQNIRATLQLVRGEAGVLTITIERELPTRDGGTMKGTTTENWHLSEDGKTLTIDRVDTGRPGMRESKMVFVRP